MQILDQIREKENDEAWWRQNIQDLVLAASEEDNQALRHSNYKKSQERYVDLKDVVLPDNATVAEIGSGPGANLLILQHLNPSCTIYGYEQIEEQAKFSRLLVEYYFERKFIHQRPYVIPATFEGNEYFKTDYVLHSNIDISFDDVLSKLCGALPILTSYPDAQAAKLILRFADSIGETIVRASHKEEQMNKVFEYFPNVERISNVLIVSDWHKTLLQKIPQALKYAYSGTIQVKIARVVDAILNDPKWSHLRPLIEDE